MPIVTLFSSFNLHVPGGTAEAAAKASPLITSRGNSATGAADFTDPNKDLQALGVTTSHKIDITEGSDIRDESISAVVTSVVTVGGGNFSATENNLAYTIYLPSTDTEIINDPTKRGTGSVGFAEYLGKIDALITVNSALENLVTNTISLEYGDNLSEQVIVFEDGS